MVLLLHPICSSNHILRCCDRRVLHHSFAGIVKVIFWLRTSFHGGSFHKSLRKQLCYGLLGLSTIQKSKMRTCTRKHTGLASKTRAKTLDERLLDSQWNHHLLTLYMLSSSKIIRDSLKLWHIWHYSNHCLSAVHNDQARILWHDYQHLSTIVGKLMVAWWLITILMGHESINVFPKWLHHISSFQGHDALAVLLVVLLHAVRISSLNPLCKNKKRRNRTNEQLFASVSWDIW